MRATLAPPRLPMQAGAFCRFRSLEAPASVISSPLMRLGALIIMPLMSPRLIGLSAPTIPLPAAPAFAFSGRLPSSDQALQATSHLRHFTFMMGCFLTGGRSSRLMPIQFILRLYFAEPARLVSGARRIYVRSGFLIARRTKSISRHSRKINIARLYFRRMRRCDIRPDDVVSTCMIGRSHDSSCWYYAGFHRDI